MASIAFANSPAEKVIIVFENDVDKTIIEDFNIEVEETFTHIPAVSGDIPEEDIKELEKSEQVLAVEINQEVHLNNQQLDWGLNKIEAQRSWASSYTGKDVKIAVLDTGIAEHDDLKVAGGVSIVTEDPTMFSDDHGHGTHVAGIIGAKDNNVGVVGVSPDASLYAVKVLNDTGKGRLSDVIKGIEWAISNEMDIINLSLGASQHSFLFKEVVDRAYDNGILVVAAAGNNGNDDGSSDTVEYPARYSSAIAVAATDSSDLRGPFSATGAAIELAAPGVNIKSTNLNNNYTTNSGTSMAASFVTGALALTMEAEPTFSHVQLREHLQQTALDFEPSGRDTHFGYGLVQSPFESELNNIEAPMSAKEWLAYAESKSSASHRLNEYIAGYEWYPSDSRFEDGIHASSRLLFNWAKTQHDLERFETAIDRYKKILAAPVIDATLQQEVEKRLEDAESGRLSADSLYEKARNESKASYKLELYIEGNRLYPDDSRFKSGIQSSAQSLLIWARGQQNSGNFEKAIDRYHRIISVEEVNKSIKFSTEKHLAYALEKKVVPTANEIYKSANSQTKVSSIYTEFVLGYVFYPEDSRFINGVYTSSQQLFDWAKLQHNAERYSTAIDRYELILTAPIIKDALKKEVEDRLANAKLGKPTAQVIYDQATTEPRASYKLQLYIDGYNSYSNDHRFNEGIQSSAQSLLIWARGQHNSGKIETAIDRYHRILNAPALNSSLRVSTERHLSYAQENKSVPEAKELYKSAISQVKASYSFNAFVLGYEWYPGDSRFEEGVHTSSEALFDWAKQQHNKGRYDTAISRYEVILTAPIIKDSLKLEVEKLLVDAKKQS